MILPEIRAHTGGAYCLAPSSHKFIISIPCSFRANCLKYDCFCVYENAFYLFVLYNYVKYEISRYSGHQKILISRYYIIIIYNIL